MQVGVIMGSDSDLATMAAAAQVRPGKVAPSCNWSRCGCAICSSVLSTAASAAEVQPGCDHRHSAPWTRPVLAPLSKVPPSHSATASCPVHCGDRGGLEAGRCDVLAGAEGLRRAGGGDGRVSAPHAGPDAGLRARRRRARHPGVINVSGSSLPELHAAGQVLAPAQQPCSS